MCAPYQEEEDHADAVVEGGEEAADDALGHRVHQLGRELEKDRARGVRQARRAYRRREQLGCNKNIILIHLSITEQHVPQIGHR